MTIQEAQDEIIEEFKNLDNWIDKHNFLIKLGKNLSPIDSRHKIEKNLISGCQVNTWFHSELKDGKIFYNIDSNSIMIKGFIALLTRVLSGQKEEDIKNTDLYFIDKIGLRENFSPLRANSLFKLVNKMKLRVAQDSGSKIKKLINTHPMKQFLIYDSSLRFARATYGVLTLIAFFIHSYWLVLATGILMVFGIISIKLNLPYQFHVLILRNLLKDKSELIEKELGELNFVSGATAGLLFIGFLPLYFGKFVDFAWIFILIVALLIFLACFVGFCVATLMYVFFKKIFKR